MKAFARIFAAVLVFAVLFSGCGRAMEAKDPGNLTVEENTAPDTPG